MKSIKEKQKKLRQYIRLLGTDLERPNARKAQQYFIIIHNFLHIERKFFDQMMMFDAGIAQHLRLQAKPKNIKFCIWQYEGIFDVNHPARKAIENVTSISDIKYWMKELDANQIHKLYSELMHNADDNIKL